MVHSIEKCLEMHITAIEKSEQVHPGTDTGYIVVGTFLTVGIAEIAITEDA